MDASNEPTHPDSSSGDNTGPRIVEVNPFISDCNTSGKAVAASANNSFSTRIMVESERTTEPVQDGWVEINDDVYNMFFLSKIGDQSFWFAVYIFLLKIAVFTFLILDALAQPKPEHVPKQVYITQLLMIPVGVTMQDDLMSSYYSIANLNYSPLIQLSSPHATEWKYYVANVLRGVDGMYSLLVNFIIMMKQTQLFPLFIIFAALEFFTSVDNIALMLCEQGYLSVSLEEAAYRVKRTKLPKKKNAVIQALDNVLFLSTCSGLIIAWGVIIFA